MIVALLNQKGGVGKTTLALHLAGEWARGGKRVTLIDADPQGSVRRGLSPALAADVLTHVELTWVEKKIEFWIRFGRETAEQILDRRRRVVSFAPNSVFAFVRWTSNEYGTALSRLDIVRAVNADERCQTLPFVRPGGDILLRADGWPKVERVLQLVDAIEARGIDPIDVSPDHWHHVHNRLTAGEAPRAYDAQQHRAFLLRRKVGA